MAELVKQIASQLQITVNQVQSTLQLLEEGNTVPFIARYRKEMTKGLDEEAIRQIEEQYQYQVNLAKRKEDVLRLIAEQGKLTDEIKRDIAACDKLSMVEDIYRPYQQKRKTRATMAVALGLEPLAQFLLDDSNDDVAAKAALFIKEGVGNVEEALQGAMDIVAEMASDHVQIRNKARFLMRKFGVLKTSAKKNHADEKKVYQMYYEHSERLATVANHRIMAIDRAEKEKVITVSVEFDDQELFAFSRHSLVKYAHEQKNEYLEKAIKDGLKRLLIPSVERELRAEMSEKAHLQSIDVFSMNVERLLLQPPMKDKLILGVDPAFRTGCKLAVIDRTGKLLFIDVMYPHAPVNKVAEAKATLSNILKKYPIDIIAIGNGTASRETQSFVAQVIHELNSDVQFTLVSEAGASVYSASNLARSEFPDLQVEQRSAVSIARRVLDPLAELIKIDPQSIGVGQYQHDLPTSKLAERLAFVVSKAVNRVGVNVNTASVQLLEHVSGLSAASAKEVVAHRNEIGKFKNRAELLKVKKIGAKSFEQAAGFLRILDGNEVLDQSGIHPESYPLTYRLMQKMDITVQDIGGEELKLKLNGISITKLCEEMQCDEYTLLDILDNLKQPQRDYRDNYEAPLLRSDVLSLQDLKEGDELEGVVRNVVDFGAFVDIGLKEDGLIHISKLSKGRISHPSEIVQIGDIIKVKVYRIDEERQKVQLALREAHA